MTTLYYHHDDFLHHDTGPGHPESPARLQHIHTRLSRPQFSQLHAITATNKNNIEALIALIHTTSHFKHIASSIPPRGLTHIDPDTVLSPRSGEAAFRAVSTVCEAVDAVINKQADNAFCAVRPPGHHAEPGKAMGFCLFNNIAIAAAYALNTYAVEKVAIIDFDVHHGNGTQAAFVDNPAVFYASSHQMPYYPGTGHPDETGCGNILNVPLAAGEGSASVRTKYRDVILPAVAAFKPELILISAGFDAHKDDPLASVMLETEDFAWLTREIMSIAEQSCAGRLISVLEGGYDLQALADSVSGHVEILLERSR